MASASDDRINKTIDYLKTFQGDENDLYLFPIHCSGDEFLFELKNLKESKIKAFNASVGTVFNF